MARITVELPDIKGNEVTYLTADVAAAATSLTVKNTNRFEEDQYVIVGKPGVENTEIRKIASVTPGTTIVVDALKFAHPAKTTITHIPYNQAKIYRAASETGTYTLIETIALDVDMPDGTNYEDVAGTTSSWYKVAYYNSTTEAISAYSAPIAATGFTVYSLRSMVDDILSLVNDPNAEYISRDNIKDKLNNHQLMWWINPYRKRGLVSTSTLVTVASQNYVELPDDFDKLLGDYSVNFNYVDETTDETGYLRIRSKSEFNTIYADQTEDYSDDIVDCYIDSTTNRLYLGPTPESADLEITIEYQAKPTLLDADTDETKCPVPRILTYGVAAEIELSRGNFDKASLLQNLQQGLILGDMAYANTRTGTKTMKFLDRRGYERYR